MWIASWITWEPISKWYLFLLISVDEDYAYDSQLHIYVTARISGEARGEAVPVHCLARSRGARSSHATAIIYEASQSHDTAWFRSHSNTL